MGVFICGDFTMNAALQWINSAGTGFVEFAVAMLVQSGILIILLLLIDFGLRRKVRAVFRYWLWVLVLAKLVLPTSLSTPISIGRLAGDKLNYFSTQHVLRTEPEPANIMREGDAAQNIAAGNSSAVETYPTAMPAPTPSTSIPTQIEPETSRAIKLAGAQDQAVAVTWQAVLFLVWVVIAAAMGLLLLQRAFFVRGLVAQSRQPGSLLTDALEFCRKQMHLRCRVGLKVSVNAVSPAVCGLFRPVILVPASLASNLSSRDLRMVLMHELAHIKRGDLWVNLAQTLLQIAYFYNPLLWLANAAIRRVREQAVDEAVMAAMGERAGWYPETLVNVAKAAFHRPALSLRLIGVVESKNALAGRIKHILGRPFPKSARLGLVGLIVIIVTGAILLPMAKAKSSRGAVIAPPPFKAGLPNGVTVELVGMGTAPWESEQQWWQPDGADMNEPEFKANHPPHKWPQGPDRLQFRCAALVRFSNHAGKDVTVPELDFKSPLSLLASGMASAIADDGSQLTYIVSAPNQTLPDSTDIRLAVGAGKFIQAERIEKYIAEQHQVYLLENKCTVIVHPLRTGQIGTPAVDITIAEGVDGIELRVKARLENGQIEQWAGGSLGKVRWFQSTPKRKNTRIEDIEDLIVEYRHYQWVTFENVALKPGLKTDVQVKVEKARAGSPETLGALHLAVLGGHQETVAMLLSEGFDVNGKDSEGNTPLDIAAANGHIQMAEFLISKGANVNAVNNKAQTPLHLATGNGHAATARFLLSKGAAAPVAAGGGEQANKMSAVLPDVDEQPMMLDLASGELLEIPQADSPEQIWSAIERLGRGDLVYDTQALILVRRASADVTLDTVTGSFKRYKIGSTFPKQITVTTKEGVSYRVTIDKADDNGCSLRWRQVETREPPPTDNKLQAMIDNARPGAVVPVPPGVYRQAITIDKPLVLKGDSPQECIFEVTANKPAIFVKAGQENKVLIENIAVKWQLATSERAEMPFAVAVLDSRAEVTNCLFYPLGNFKRCPVAVKSLGFSHLRIESCRFEGFEYTVCFGEGSEGEIANSIVTGSGHQGISLYSGAKAEIVRNIVCGSRYHGVRSTARCSKHGRHTFHAG